MSQSKQWCFTLNNYTSDEVKAIKAKFEDPAVDLRYGIIGHEVGDNGTPHLQGYCSFNKNLRFKGIKAILGERAHVEIARVTRNQTLNIVQSPVHSRNTVSVVNKAIAVTLMNSLKCWMTARLC